MRKLKTYFQQRHLFAPCQGIVDNDYVTRSGDKTYAVGQRLIITPDAVVEFADLVERLGQAVIECGDRFGLETAQSDVAG